MHKITELNDLIYAKQINDKIVISLQKPNRNRKVGWQMSLER